MVVFLLHHLRSTHHMFHPLLSRLRQLLHLHLPRPIPHTFLLHLHLPKPIPHTLLLHHLLRLQCILLRPKFIRARVVVPVLERSTPMQVDFLFPLLVHLMPVVAHLAKVQGPLPSVRTLTLEKLPAEPPVLEVVSENRFNLC